MSKIPLAPVKRMIQNQSNLRVSKGAAEVLQDYLLEYGIKVSRRAYRFAKASNRKTVSGDDVYNAVKSVEED